MLGAPIRTGAASVVRFAAAIRNRPADLLIARHQVIPYIDRGGLLEEALNWARSQEAALAQGRLYVASGGFGETRFAIEMILALMAEGWSATFLSARNTRNLPPGALSDLVAGDEAVGSLIVVDYAESQIALLQQAAEVAAASTAKTPIRLVALARSVESWWQGIQADEGISSVFIDPAPIVLIQRPLEADERAVFFDTASAAFRDALAEAGLATPAVQPADIRGQTYDRPLTVAMAAFLFARGVAPDERIGVFERIFMEERKHWRRLLRVQADDDPAVASLHRAAAQITLVQGATREGAAALIAADPRAAEYSRPARDQCLVTLERLYGDTTETRFLRPVELDLLGEHAAMAALSQDRDGLIQATFATALSGTPLFPQDVAEIVTVLTRATRYEHDTKTRAAASAAIGQLCNAVSALDGVKVRHVEASLPRFAVPLTGLAVAVTRRVVETSEDPAEEARALNNLATFLSETGDRQAALTPARRAVEIYQELAQANPAAYLPDLAMSLNNLANRLSETGDRQAALTPARRAVEIREELAQANPAAYLPNLAMSLNNLANRLSETGDRQAALTPARRAVEIYQELAQANPAAYLPDLATSHWTLGDVLRAADDVDGATSAYSTALTYSLQCLESAPARFAPYIAVTADRLSSVLTAAGRADEIEPVLRAILGNEIFEALRSARSSDSGVP